jgi:hypothetical protein
MFSDEEKHGEASKGDIPGEKERSPLTMVQEKRP